MCVDVVCACGREVRVSVCVCEVCMRCAWEVCMCVHEVSMCVCMRGVRVHVRVHVRWGVQSDEEASPMSSLNARPALTQPHVKTTNGVARHAFRQRLALTKHQGLESWSFPDLSYLRHMVAY